MRVVYFNRYKEGVNIFLSSSADCLFIPSKSLIILKENGAGYPFYSIVKDLKLLKEVESISEGKDPYEKNRKKDYICPTFSNIKIFDCDDKKIERLLNQISAKSELEEKINSGFEDIILAKDSQYL